MLLVAIFLRLHNLDTIPDGLLHDEAYNGIDALRILAGERPIFLIDNNGREALFVYLQAISVALLGQTSLALRVVSAILGIMTVAATYPLIRRMFDARVALLTSGWLAISLLASDRKSGRFAENRSASLSCDWILLPLARPRESQYSGKRIKIRFVVFHRRLGYRALPLYIFNRQNLFPSSYWRSHSTWRWSTANYSCEHYQD